jgi:hypothetical protein
VFFDQADYDAVWGAQTNLLYAMNHIMLRLVCLVLALHLTCRLNRVFVFAFVF